jgi:hypothetical protein
VEGQHRQERQQRAGPQHAEHVAKVGAGGHLDIFNHIHKRFPALDHALLEHEQALLEQDDIG